MAMESPVVGNHNEDVVPRSNGFRVDHDSVVKESSHLSGARKESIVLKKGAWAFNKFCTKDWPGVGMNRKNNKNLKGVIPLERWFFWVRRVDER